MATTTRGKTTTRPVAVRRRRKSNSLGSFMLWAFFSWLFAKTGHRGPMNPYARPSDRPAMRRRVRKAAAARRGGGGGGGASGHGAGQPATRGPEQKKAPLDTPDGPDDGGFLPPIPEPDDSDGPDDGGFLPDDDADDDADGGDDDSSKPGFEPAADGAV